MEAGGDILCGDISVRAFVVYTDPGSNRLSHILNVAILIAFYRSTQTSCLLILVSRILIKRSALRIYLGRNLFRVVILGRSDFFQGRIV